MNKTVKEQRKNKIDKGSRFFSYVFAASIILESNSIFSQIYGYHSYIRTLLIVLAAFSAVYIFIRNCGREKLKFKRTTVLYIAYLLLISTLLLNNTTDQTGQMIILSIFVFSLPVFLMLFTNAGRELFKMILESFINTMVVLCAVSLMIWLMSSMLGILQPNVSVQTLWGNVNNFKGYFYIHFDTQEVWWITGSPIMRNSGIFTEGPMYAAMIAIAQIFHNLVLREETKSHIRKSIILFATMLSTMSVAGILCSLIIIFIANGRRVCAIFGQKNKVLIAIIGVILSIIIMPMILGLINSKSETGSAKHRNMDINNGMEVFAEHPLVGLGINHERADESNADSGYGYSNAIIPIMTDGGVILLLVYVLPPLRLLICHYKSKEKKNNMPSLFFVVIIYGIVLFTMAIPYRLSMVFLLAAMARMAENQELEEKGALIKGELEYE